MTTNVQQNTDRAAEMAAGLRALADMIQAHPEVVDDLRYPLNWMMTSVDGRTEVSRLARAGAKSGAAVKKHGTDRFAGVDIAFGPVNLRVYADREEVCERVVTGTREVTKEVPDPEALAAVPTVTVTEVVEDVEWRCASFLAPAPKLAAEVSA